MKPLYIIGLFWITMISNVAHAQSKPSVTTLLTVQFKVDGVCGQCKDRIEKAAKGKGVKSVMWDESTKLLQLVYDTTKTTVDKVQNRIVAVGHDINDKKAKNSVYKALPECCLYREIEASDQDTILSSQEVISEDTIAIPQLQDSAGLSNVVNGIVLETY